MPTRPVLTMLIPYGGSVSSEIAPSSHPSTARHPRRSSSPPQSSRCRPSRKRSPRWMLVSISTRAARSRPPPPSSFFLGGPAQRGRRIEPGQLRIKPDLIQARQLPGEEVEVPLCQLPEPCCRRCGRLASLPPSGRRPGVTAGHAVHPSDCIAFRVVWPVISTMSSSTTIRVFHEAEPLKRCRDFLDGLVVLARVALVWG